MGYTFHRPFANERTPQGTLMTRTVCKTMSYGFMHLSIAILVAYLLSGSWKVALAIGLVEPCCQTIAFFFHERLWHRLEKKWSRKDYHDSVIDSVSPATPLLEDILRNKT